MRRLLIFVVAMSAALAAAAQMGSTSRAMLGIEGVGKSAKGCRAESADSAQAEPQAPYVPMIIMADSEQSLDSLGVIIWHRRQGMLLASVPRDSVDDVVGLDGVICAEAALQASACMDVARPLCGVDRVQAGSGLPEAYRGQGMLVGFADIGFDANHIAFAGRVKGFFHYDASWGKRVALTDPQEIAAYRTDSAGMWHATHVANILAGGYMGNGYYGVAPEADIAASCSPLDDVSILCGVEEIIALGKSRGQRPVINLSLSSNLGAHDGTSLMCRYLAACGDDAMICLSAGNFGQRKVSASHCFDQDGIRRLTVNNAKTWVNFDVNGATEFWGADARPFELRVEVYDNDTREVVFASPWVQDGELKVSADSFPEWGRYMRGEAYAAACLSPLNGRYSATAAYGITTEPVASAGPWSRYVIALAVRCSAGQQIDAFADGSRSFISNVAKDSFYPNSDMSISDLATARGVMSVGMCGSRSSAPGGFEWDIDVKAMSPYSAYGLGLPTIAAPGYYVVSAISGEYMDEHPDTRTAACVQAGGQSYWWTPDCGTSMSSPYAAGALALWLQANPSLTNADLISIAVSTAVQGDADPHNPRWGAGRLDAYAGLQQALRLASADAAPLPPQIRVNPDRTIEIPCPARVYTPAGGLAATTSGSAAVGPLPPGIYLIVTDGFTKKIAI